MTELEEERKTGKEDRISSSDWAEVTRFAGSLIVFILGALMIAEGVVKSVAGSTIFFPSVDGNFEFVVGFVVIVLAASIMSVNRSRLSGVRRSIRQI